MSLKHYVAVLVLFGLSFSTEVTRGALQEEELSRWIMRRPSDFTDVPQVIQRQLEQAQCRIPQAPNWRIHHNLVWGEFERKGQQDLAVLCVRGQTAVIYVYWASDAARRDQLPINHGYQPGSWMKVATPKFIQEHIAAYGLIDKGMPEHIEHDGVEDGIACCSIVYYRQTGRWLRSPGAD
jgi:hypothetical protein